jgi:hypothetical protein
MCKNLDSVAMAPQVLEAQEAGWGQVGRPGIRPYNESSVALTGPPPVSLFDFNRPMGPTFADCRFSAPGLFPTSPFPIEREPFAVLRGLPDIVPLDLPKTRTQLYLLQQVVVLKAVLEKSKFGQGDTLIIDLLADQELNEIVGAYKNKRFHVTRRPAGVCSFHAGEAVNRR